MRTAAKDALGKASASKVSLCLMISFCFDTRKLSLYTSPFSFCVWLPSLCETIPCERTWRQWWSWGIRQPGPTSKAIERAMAYKEFQFGSALVHTRNTLSLHLFPSLSFSISFQVGNSPDFWRFHTVGAATP